MASASPPAQHPLPPGWTEHKAPTGHSYYYNAATKQSTYKRPINIEQFAPPSLPPQPPQPQQYPVAANFSAPAFGQTPYANSYHPGQGFNPYPNPFPNPFPQQFPSAPRGRGGFRGGHGYQDRRRQQPEDRPKHKHAIPNCAPWILVQTKLKRRFVHNPETGESFWKFPEDVMKGVVEFDRLERERKERKEKGDVEMADGDEDEDEEAAAAAELAAMDREGSDGPSKTPVPQAKEDKGYDSDEYEEVEVTDDEGEEGGVNGEDGPSKRQRTEEDQQMEDQPVEFGEDDIAYQLQAMGEDYGLDPGEYGHPDDAENWEEGAEGLPLTEDDARALFYDLLDDYRISPFTTWDKIIEEGRIIDDDRYVAFSSMKERKAAFQDWSKDRAQKLKEEREKAAKRDPRIPYMAFLQKNANPKLYWPEFRRKFKKEPEMRDMKLSDKEREKAYREHIARLKMPAGTLKSDLTTLLKSVPLIQLNRGTSMEALPAPLLTDIRFISLPPNIRDPMVEAYIATLPEAPEGNTKSVEELEADEKKKQERERREKALAEREKRVQEEKRRQMRDLEFGRGRLRQEEIEIERAMKVGKDGLKAQLD
ncbi:hypothetical protein K490DRAFT_2141, partial [Saccharata proteae CBS 121410]